MSITKSPLLPLYLIAAASCFMPSVIAAFAPSSKNELRNALNHYCTDPTSASSATYGPIGNWDVSQITDFNNLFYQSKSCNPDISGWNVSNGQNFQSMFEGVSNFDHDISGWNVASGTNFRQMFYGATNFNQDIGAWNVASSTNFNHMFSQASSFDQDISNWDVSSGTGFTSVFAEATSFNQDLNTWDVSSGTDFSGMFYHNTSFNGNIGNWNVASGTNFAHMFWGATSFNQNIGNWNVASSTDFRQMFHGAANFDQDINSWDVSSGTSFHHTFARATSFNQDLSGWNVSSATGIYAFEAMFYDATSFDQDIGSWDVSGSTNFGDMFYKAMSFDQDISNWNVANGMNFRHMFDQSTSFNQDISNWDVASGTDFYNTFKGATSFNQPQLYCNWASISTKFKGTNGVCDGTQSCGWGNDVCPTPAPTSAPTHEPTPAPTPVPTHTPTTALPTFAPTTAAEKAKNEFQISLIDDSIDVAFNDSRLDSEIMMKLNITTDNIPDLSPIKVYDYDTCSSIAYDSSILGTSVSAGGIVADADTNGLFSTVPVKVDLNTTDIVRFNNSVSYPGFFNAQEESVVLQFCLKPTLGLSEVYRNGVSEETYISYTKIKVQIELDMAMNFSTAAVNIKEDAPSESTEDVNVDYTLNAYECDAATKLRIDNPSVKSQNSLITVCIETTFSDIVVGSIKELTLTESNYGLTYKAIDNSMPTSITEVSSTGTMKAAVSTRLVAAFFTNLGNDQSTIDIAGIAVLEFDSGARRLVRIGNSANNQQTINRVLDDSEDGPLGTFAFSVDISKKNDAASAATKTKSILAALFGAFMGLALVL